MAEPFVSWRCLNKECGHQFSCPIGRHESSPPWEWCPKCRASSRAEKIMCWLGTFYAPEGASAVTLTEAFFS